MEIRYVKELGNNYMVIGAGAQKNEYAYRIMSENEISGLLPISKSSMDGKTDYYYEINGLTSIDRFYSRKVVEYDELKNIMLALARLPEKLDEYLIDKSYVCLSPETIYMGNKDGEIFFALYPDKKSDYYAGFREIATFFLSKINHQDTKCVTAGYGAFEIAGRESFGMEEIAELFGGEGEVTDKGFEDEILAFNEEEYDIVVEDDDIFDDEEDDYYERDLETGLKKFSDVEEKMDVKARIKGFLPTVLLLLGIILSGVFLFVTPAASSMSLGIKIVCFVMICTAMVLVRLLLRGRFNSEK